MAALQPLKVHVHWFTGDRLRVPLPEAALARVLASAGVALTVVGQTPSLGPPSAAGAPRTEAQLLAVLDRVAPQAARGLGAPAHLFVARTWDKPGAERALGALLHPKRGAAAVFLEHLPSDVTERASAFLQVCAHELGHVLNLRHEDAHCTASPSAICQALQRTGGYTQPWIDSGNAEGAPPGVAAYPFSTSCRDRVATLAREQPPLRLLTWGSEFEALGSAAENDVASDVRPRAPRGWRSLHLGLHVPRGSLCVGDLLALRLDVRNAGRRALALPSWLAPENGEVELALWRPGDRRPYVHRPRLLVCETRWADLKPGALRRSHALLDDGPGYAVLPTPGRYSVHARLSRCREVRVAAEFTVAPTARAGGADMNLARWVARGGGPQDHVSVAAARQLVKARAGQGMPRVLRGRCAYLLGLHAPRGKSREGWLRRARGPSLDPITRSELRHLARASALPKAGRRGPWEDAR